MFAAMTYEPGELKLIDQRLLPLQEVWLSCKDLEAVAKGIEDMVVRGAPAIGCAAAYGLDIDVHHSDCKTFGEYQPRFKEAIARLARTRPTAVNLFYAIDAMTELAKGFDSSTPMNTVKDAIAAKANELFEDDIRTCKAIGQHGLSVAEANGGKKLRVLTHCNTGSLATAG